MRRSLVMRALLTTLAGSTLLSCEAAEELLNQLVPKTGPRQLSDEDAFKYLAPDNTAAPKTDVASVMEVLDSETQRSAGNKQSSTLSPGARKLLKKAALGRRIIDTEKFPQNMSGNLGGTSPKQGCSADVDLDASDLRDEFTIPQLEKVPVRNQSYRGTCAAFTGIGALEYAALNEMSPGGNASLPALDLSEQRFYWMSKFDCQNDGCPSPYSEGSWYGDGFTYAEGESFTADSAVPLESDCPYTPQPGDTDLGPQPSACEKGAVNVGKLETWCGYQQIIDWLHKGYAVPFASPLSDNWENNDGLITLKDFAGAGATVHAGGHAYLIVGYKKLPANMPESEGGLCFVIKNSWGTGWGAGGYSCMTLGWMNEVKFDFVLAGVQPIPVDVLLREDLQAAELPPDEPDEEVVPDYEPEYEEEEPIDDEEERLDPLPPDPDPNGEEINEDDTGEDPAEDPTPEPPMDAFQPARLHGPNERFYKVLVAPEGSELRIKGVLKAGGQSKQVRVVLQGNKLIYKGDQVGSYDASEGVLSLCTEEFANLCALRYRDSNKFLYIQYRDEDLRSVKPSETAAEKGDWADVSLFGQNYGLFVPADVVSVDFLANPKTFVRLGSGAPTRVSITPSTEKAGFGGFDLKVQGLKVGEVLFSDLTNASLCTGKFESVCGVIGATDALDILPRNERKRDGD